MSPKKQIFFQQHHDHEQIILLKKEAHFFFYDTKVKHWLLRRNWNLKICMYVLFLPRNLRLYSICREFYFWHTYFLWYQNGIYGWQRNWNLENVYHFATKFQINFHSRKRVCKINVVNKCLIFRGSVFNELLIFSNLVFGSRFSFLCF